MSAPAPDAAPWLDRAGRQLDAGDLSAAAATAAEAVAEHPDIATLWNMHGALLAAQGRMRDAIAALDRAAALDPADPEPLGNLVGLHLDRRDWDKAKAAGFRLLALKRRDGEAHRRLAHALAGAGDRAAAEARLRVATCLAPKAVEAWLDLIAMLRLRDPGEAVLAAGAAHAVNPEDPRLLAASRELEALTILDEGLAADPADPARLQRRLALAHARLADPAGWSPIRSDGLELERARAAVVAALDAGLAPKALPWAAAPILARLLDWETLDRLGGFEAAGEADPRNLMLQLSRASASPDDRLALVGQHRLWGARAEAAAARAPIAPPPTARAPPAPRSRLRLGFVSSDLRNHPVGSFAWPVFEHLDRDRFELHVYSFFDGPADQTQKAFAERTSVWRRLAGVDARGVAEAIAADDLDVVFDLGGLTGAARPEAMAYRLAPVQASWLGYPHSMGLSTIDHILLDPYVVPPTPGLLVEAPLLMPRSWIAMDGRFFRDEPRPAAAPPSVEAGFVTFGTANASYKYGRVCIDLWAQALEAVPGSRFLAVRPEADAPTFRRHVLEGFAARGIAPERVGFAAVRGGHLPFYDRIDISLDTTPVTGGTTTCESLWMGVPVVTLVGEALYERQSYSILVNAGLGDLATETPHAYVAKAAELAGDGARLARLRSGLRDQIRAGPLGDAAGFARDFYDLVARTVAAKR